MQQKQNENISLHHQPLQGPVTLRSFPRCRDHDCVRIHDLTQGKSKEKHTAGLDNVAPKRMKAPAPQHPQAPPSPPDPLLGAAQDEEGLDAVLLEVGIALAPTARLHLVVAIQVVECGLGDVDASAGGEGSGTRGQKT